MTVADKIVKIIDDRGMTQQEAADLVGISRQNLWDKLNRNNPRFRSVTLILDKLGYKLQIVACDGMGAEFDGEKLLEVFEQENLLYESAEKIVKVIDHDMKIIKK